MKNYKSYLQEYSERINYADYNAMSSYDMTTYLDNAEKYFSNTLSCIEKLDGYFKDKELIIEERGFNTSSIYSFLIKKAAKHCNYYASDLFIDLEAFDDFLKFKPMKQFNYYFGFRDNGVDHHVYIANKIFNSLCYGAIENNYKEIYMIEVDKNDEVMNLYKVF